MNYSKTYGGERRQRDLQLGGERGHHCLAGLSLAPSAGAITGQPTTAATSNFTIQVTDSNMVTAPSHSA